MNFAELRSLLRSVDASQSGAPARVEAALLREHRRRHRRRWWAYLAPVPVAAAVVLAVLPGEAPPAPVRPAAPAAPAFAYVVPEKRLPMPAKAVPAPRVATPTEEFVPLFAGSGLLPLEGAQVVRVAIPRSALAPAGFPVNPARLEERVRADVLLGQDGLIRGIRFVR
jgi:hypothetical protein